MNSGEGDDGSPAVTGRFKRWHEEPFGHRPGGRLGVSIALWTLAGATAVFAVAAVLTRRLVRSRPGAFKARIRRAEGVNGLSRKWRGGYGRWVRDVLVWNKGPLLFHAKLIPIEGVDTSRIRDAASTRAEHIGNESVVLPFVTEDRGRVEIVVSARDRDAALGPFAHAAAIGSLVMSRFAPLEADQ